MVFGDSDWAGSESRRSTTGAFEQVWTASHRIQLLDTARHCPLERRGRAVRLAGGLQSVQLLDCRLEWSRSWKYSRTVPRTSACTTELGSGRVRHLDVKWLWTQEAVQYGRFSLKKVSTDRNVSDLTTNHHHEDRLAVLMSLGRLRFARGRGDAVLAANEGRTAAVNAVRRTRRARSTELDENFLKLWGDISSLADPGGRERQRALRDGRLAERGQDQHTSDAPVGRGSVDSAQEPRSTASCSLEDGEDATTTEQGIRAIPLKYAAFGNSSLVRLGLVRSYLQLTTTTGLISCDAGEHCLDSLRAGNERQR